jgi:hypothetical protein
MRDPPLISRFRLDSLERMETVYRYSGGRHMGRFIGILVGGEIQHRSAWPVLVRSVAGGSATPEGGVRCAAS